MNGEPPVGRRLLREAALLALLWAVYSVGRWVAAQHAGNAFVHADEVWAFERLLQMPSEAQLQGWLMRWPTALRGANGFYAWVHVPTEDGATDEARLARVCLAGERWRTDGPPLAELLEVVDRTEERLREGRLTEAC